MADPTPKDLDHSVPQVRIQLSSPDKDISLPENTGSILVNTNLRRYALSTLVNALLETPRPIPFEFLINGAFLRTTLEEYLAAHGISSETVLNVEYVRATIPPLYLASIPEDDWISAVDVLSGAAPAAQWTTTTQSAPQAGAALILSGSYDGHLRVWGTSQQLLGVSAAEGRHRMGVKDAKWISPAQMASGGMDGVLRVWKYGASPENLREAAAITPAVELYGHKASVECIAVHQPSSRMLSASADHAVGLWSMRKSDAPAAPASLIPQTVPGTTHKKRKLGTSTPQRGPLGMLTSHSAPVSSTIFKPDDATVAHSASWDHAMKTWDLTTMSLVDTRTTSHALLSLAALSELNLLAVGTSARHITLVDPRDSATTVAAMTLRGHANAVVALDRDPRSAYGLVSGSHDGTCRVWDVRSGRNGKEGVVGESTFTIARESAREEARRPGGEGVKVFGVRWDAEVGVVSCGEDKRVQINRAMGGG